MSTYIALIDVKEQAFQNPKEFATIWGDIRADIERIGGTYLHGYALLGDYDFQVVFEVDDEDDAFQIALTIHRHGLRTNTMRAVRDEDFGKLVDDI